MLYDTPSRSKLHSNKLVMDRVHYLMLRLNLFSIFVQVINYIGKMCAQEKKRIYGTESTGLHLLKMQI